MHLVRSHQNRACSFKMAAFVILKERGNAGGLVEGRIAIGVIESLPQLRWSPLAPGSSRLSRGCILHV